MICKYQVTVTRTDIFNVEIDNEVFNEEWAKDFSSYMWDIDPDDSAREAARNIAIETARQGKETFIEGFGIIPLKDSLYTKRLRERGERMAEGVIIESISEDDVEAEVEYIGKGDEA